MGRHTTFRLCLDVTVEQQKVLSRHVGAARFAYNQCLRVHLDARAHHRGEQGGGAPGSAASVARVPWSGFDLINAFNAWKRSPEAGRRFVVYPGGVAEVEVTGLAWRGEVLAQVFEEAAVDLGRALKAWTDPTSRARHPRFTKKTTGGSFRVRNKTTQGRPCIRVGGDRARSVTLPKIGTLRVHEDTRRLRRMIANGRARVLYATVSRGAGRWWILLTVQAADLHPAARHVPRAPGDVSGWVGVDRGLSALVVAATAHGEEVLRVQDAPRAWRHGLRRLRQLSRAVARKQRGSSNRARAAARLSRHHARVRARRQHFAYQVSTALVKTHDRLVLEDLNIAGMLTNHHLAAAISDAAWGELARQIGYKQSWRGGQVLQADRWYPSSKTCSACGHRSDALTLAVRTYRCARCSLVIDRDLNAAINLAVWATGHTRGLAQGVGDRQADGPVTNAHRRDGTALARAPARVEPTRMTWEPRPRPLNRSEHRTPEKGGALNPKD